jgi:hypothetical protein
MVYEQFRAAWCEALAGAGMQPSLAPPAGLAAWLKYFVQGIAVEMVRLEERIPIAVLHLPLRAGVHLPAR